MYLKPKSLQTLHSICSIEEKRLRKPGRLSSLIVSFRAEVISEWTWTSLELVTRESGRVKMLAKTTD